MYDNTEYMNMNFFESLKLSLRIQCIISPLIWIGNGCTSCSFRFPHWLCTWAINLSRFTLLPVFMMQKYWAGSCMLVLSRGSFYHPHVFDSVWTFIQFITLVNKLSDVINKFCHWLKINKSACNIIPHCHIYPFHLVSHN